MEITQGVHPRAKKFDRVGSNFGVLASNPLIRTELRENQGFGPAERKITNRSTSSRNTVFPVDNNASHGLYVQAMDLVNGSGRFLIRSKLDCVYFVYGSAQNIITINYLVHTTHNENISTSQHKLVVLHINVAILQLNITASSSFLLQVDC